MICMDKHIGILCPISVLPSKYGIGDFGKNAYDFIDKIHSSGMTIWQILPLNPLGYGNSPYQPLSSKAGDEIYLDIDQFIDEGLLKEEDIVDLSKQTHFVDYKRVKVEKEKLYQKAFDHYVIDEDFQAFIDNYKWVYDYAVYRVFKNHNDQKIWLDWRHEYKY